MDISDDPPAPRWVCWFLEQMTAVCLAAYVLALYDGRWHSAGLNACWTMANALNAYFNRLPLSSRIRAMDQLAFWRNLRAR